MGTKLTQLALVVVFSLIVIVATLIIFQAWYNNAAPTDAEIQVLVNQATKINTDAELAELNGRYETANNINSAGRIILIIEGVILTLMVIYGIMRAAPDVDIDEEGRMRRIYEG